MLSSRFVRPRAVGSVFGLCATVASAVVLAPPSHAQNRLNIPRGGSNSIRQQPSTRVVGLATSDMLTGGQNALGLAQTMVGVGVSISNVQYTGAPIAAGTFSGGTGIIGFDAGVILSSGDIASVIGPQNVQCCTSTDNAFPGDPGLDLLSGGIGYDATILEFDFDCPNTNAISFQYVFASEEYDEYVNTQYNDVFAFYLNGQNIALVPNTTTPVAINNVNCDNPFNPPAGQNCAQYNTNDCDSLTLGYPCTYIATEMDGLTSIFTAASLLLPGTNHIRLAISDTGDGVLDSNVFIRGQSFACSGVTPVFVFPSPCGQTLDAYANVPFSFDVSALATNGLPGQTVTLSVTGDIVPLAGGVFLPPLPTVPAPAATTEFEWTPGVGDVGVYQLHFTVTDQLGVTATCDVTIDVRAEPGTPFGFGDGSGAACPCGNVGDIGHGCANSINPEGALLVATGVPSVSADSLELIAEGMPNSTCVFMQGVTPISGIVFGDGLRYIGGYRMRMSIKFNVFGESEYPDWGDLPISAIGGVPTAGGTFVYQCWYRDPDQTFCTGSTFNTTNAYSVTWIP